MKVVAITWDNHSWARDRMRGIRLFHENRGDDFCFSNFKASDLWESLSGADFVYVYNGEYPIARPIRKRLIDSGVKVVSMEVAWFTQGEYWYFDESGTNGNCSLHTDSLDWLESSDFENLEKMKESYRRGRRIKDGGHVLVPFQIPTDTSMQWSPIKWMGDLVREARRVFPDRYIKFRRHPKDHRKYSDLGISEWADGDLRDEICKAGIVYGLNSTVLLESEMLGKPTVAIAKSFLNIGQSRSHALAALVARQVPMDCEDLTPWIRRGRGLECLDGI